MKGFWKWLAIVAVAAGAAVSAFFYVRAHNNAFLDPQGPIASGERGLIVLAVSLMLVVVVPMFIVLFTFARRYRAGNPKARYAPDLDRNPFATFAIWAIPIILIGTLSIINWQSTHALDPYKTIDNGVPPLTIQVIALPWKFLFIYPAQGIATVNYIAFPQGTPLNFQLTADAPMSSFWIPQLGSQIYAMAGMTTQLHLIADSQGTFNGEDTEINGQGFSGMKFVAQSVSLADFDQWVSDVKQGSDTLSLGTYDALAAPSAYQPSSTYASVDPNLYNTVVMKFMVPSSTMDAMMGSMSQPVSSSSPSLSPAMPDMPGMHM